MVHACPTHYRCLILSVLFLGCGGQHLRTQAYNSVGAKQAYESGDFSQAAEIYEKLAIREASADYWIWAARSWIAGERPKRAEAALVKTAQIDKNHRDLKPLVELLMGPSTSSQLSRESSLPDYWSKRGQNRFKRELFEGAASDFRVATELDDKRISDWVMLGHAYRHSKRLKAAAASHYRAFRLINGMTESKTEANQVLERKMFGSVLTLTSLTKDYELAARVLFDSLKDWPIRVMDRFLKSMVSRSLAPAIPVFYEKLLVHRPELISVRKRLLLSAFASGQWNKAIGLAQPIIPNPYAPAKLIEVAVEAAFRADAPRQAVSILGQRRALFPRNRGVFVDLIRGLMRAEMYVRARSELSIEIKSYSSDAEIRFSYAVALHQTGNLAGFNSELKAVLELDPNHAPALNYMGYEWAQQGKNLDRAEIFLNRALKERPDHPAYLDSLGWILYRRGRFEQAQGLLRRSLQKLPNEPEILLHMACTLRQLKQHEAALSFYEKAMRLEQNLDRKKEHEREWKRIQN